MPGTTLRSQQSIVVNSTPCTVFFAKVNVAYFFVLINKRGGRGWSLDFEFVLAAETPWVLLFQSLF